MSVVDDNDCNAATKPTDTQVSLLHPTWFLALSTKVPKFPSDLAKTHLFSLKIV
jgi:hypothetical protein